MQVLILAYRKVGESLLALRPMCAIPLIRRQLQVLRMNDWRQVIVTAQPQDQHRVEAAIGDPTSLGTRMSYLTAPYELGFPLIECRKATKGDLLIIEAHYMIEGALLQNLAAMGTTAILYDSKYGDQFSEAGYAGATFITRADLEALSPDADSLPWPAALEQLPEVQGVDIQKTAVYVAEVRRYVEPIWCEITSDADANQCKRALVTGAQKRTLDVWAWYFNRPLENWLTLLLADTPITPNQMTVIVSLVGFVVTGLLILGWMWPAVLLALVVNILDGVDGKLARVKALATRFGQLEHSFDLLYEQSWYIAYTWATFRLQPSPTVLVIGFVMLLCDSFARHVSMQFRKVMGVALADYAPFDRKFRRFDGRRNIYSLYMLLGVVAGRPFYALVAMALHAAITGLVYVLRAGLHLRRADRGIVGRQT